MVAYGKDQNNKGSFLVDANGSPIEVLEIRSPLYSDLDGTSKRVVIGFGNIYYISANEDMWYKTGLDATPVEAAPRTNGNVFLPANATHGPFRLLATQDAIAVIKDTGGTDGFANIMVACIPHSIIGS